MIEKKEEKKEFCMEKRLSNIFETTNTTKLNETIHSLIEFYKLHVNGKH